MQQLVLKVLCSTLLLLAVVPSVFSQPDCSQFTSCDQCIGDPAVADCVWRICPYPYADGNQTSSSPDFSQAKFDMSSFIGGIILVLCLQAAGFFAMRYVKSKEQSNYDPM
ncbi:uncharacterized protein cd164l2 [Pempheris klunzingeri]|uniref:uncharacterized protein cd164l2 n=1 Tax=Pempheris klunzingeri TaxID=3127111 RepID=UPI0039813FD8